MSERILPSSELFSSAAQRLPCIILCAFAIGSIQAENYQNTVVGMNPTYYYELNETDTDGGAADTMGNAPAPGVFNGNYNGGLPMVGGPGPVEVFGGVAVPGLGGEDNLAHYSNNEGHITLGDGNLFGSTAITVAFFFKAGPAQGGDRLFTNNLGDATKSFQVNTANDGLVLSVDPAGAGEVAERTLFLEDNSEPDRRLINVESGWFHVVASTEGATGPERASNFKLWINGIDRTDNLQPNSTGWGVDTGMAKIGGRRSNAADSTTHSGAQDEVAIWLNRVLTDDEIAGLWESAITEKVVPLVFTEIVVSGDDGETSVTITWQSQPNRNYAIFSSPDMTGWQEITDNYESEGDSTSFTDDAVPAGASRIYYKVEAVPN